VLIKLNIQDHSASKGSGLEFWNVFNFNIMLLWRWTQAQSYWFISSTE